MSPLDLAPQLVLTPGSQSRKIASNTDIQLPTWNLLRQVTKRSFWTGQRPTVSKTIGDPGVDLHG